MTKLKPSSFKRGSSFHIVHLLLEMNSTLVSGCCDINKQTHTDKTNKHNTHTKKTSKTVVANLIFLEDLAVF